MDFSKMSNDELAKLVLGRKMWLQSVIELVETWGMFIRQKEINNRFVYEEYSLENFEGFSFLLRKISSMFGVIELIVRYCSHEEGAIMQEVMRMRARVGTLDIIVEECFNQKEWFDKLISTMSRKDEILSKLRVAGKVAKEMRVIEMPDGVVRDYLLKEVRKLKL